MTAKYLKYELTGSHAPQDVHAALGEGVPAGQIVRVHNEAGKTTVYLAVDEAQTKPSATAEAKARASAVGTEVSLDEVLRIGKG